MLKNLFPKLNIYQNFSFCSDPLSPAQQQHWKESAWDSRGAWQPSHSVEWTHWCSGRRFQPELLCNKPVDSLADRWDNQFFDKWRASWQRISDTPRAYMSSRQTFSARSDSRHRWVSHRSFSCYKWTRVVGDAVQKSPGTTRAETYLTVVLTCLLRTFQLKCLFLLWDKKQQLLAGSKSKDTSNYCYVNYIIN